MGKAKKLRKAKQQFPVQKDGFRYYTAQVGCGDWRDTIEKVADYLLGDSQRWIEIYLINQDAIRPYEEAGVAWGQAFTDDPEEAAHLYKYGTVTFRVPPR